MSNKLILIPAREGSKGLPKKNIKNFDGKPLIQHSIEFAQRIAKEQDIICVSTDSDEIIELCKGMKIDIGFKRPSHLSSDRASMNDVILHTLEFYHSGSFENILLLQPTTPFRDYEDYLKMEEMLNSNNDTEQIVSVKKVKENPYFNMFELNKSGYLEKISLSELAINRQDSPEVFAYNGSMYLFKRTHFQQKKSLKSLKTKPYLMSHYNSCDIDTIDDFEYAEFLINKKIKCLKKE